MVGVSLLCLLLARAGADPAAADDELPLLARVGPWPVVSQLIAYRGRIWFANSVKGRNHNSADVYSYDPATGRLRYERHLFSQDAGQPVVAGGLLYWPFEDARTSVGFGHFMATDGRGWHLGVIPSARIFHTHAMAQLGDALIAATSAWRAGVQVSADGGATWRAAYDHPTPKRRVSRIVALEVLDGAAYGVLTWFQEGLLRFDGARVREVPGWPEKGPTRAIAPGEGSLYGLVSEDQGTSLWRTDGERSERLAGELPEGPARDLEATPEGLFLLTDEADGGVVWFSPDGTTWQARQRVRGGRPHDLLVADAAVFVGGAGRHGRGVLWGTADAALAGATAARLPEPPASPSTGRDWRAAGAMLDAALADPESYAGKGRTLRDAIFEMARAGPPAGFFAERLDAEVPALELSLIGGNVAASAQQYARWLLLWGMSVAGRGEVPAALVRAPWTEPANPSEKYFATPPIAMWAAAIVEHDDPVLLAALIERLGRTGDPPWLKGDAIGALTALTGERFGHDPAAWQDWWRARVGAPEK